MFNRHTGPGWFPTSLPLFIILYIILHFTSYKNMDSKKKFRHALFLVYCWIVTDLTLSPFPYSAEAIEHIRNFHSFRYNVDPSKHLITTQVSLNILFFIPFGMLLPSIVKRVRSFDIIFITFSISLFIELTQLITSLTHLNVRSFDIVDLMANTLGGIIGVILYKIYKKVKPTSSL
ncbi:MAG TPA: VanZ family protein [Erysipelothrix sp.]|nr:VanZ family protein [Erysipelothrix sp.]